MKSEEFPAVNRYPNASRINLISPDLKLLINAKPMDFEYAIGSMPEVLPAVVFDYVAHGQQKQIYEKLTKFRPHLRTDLVKIFAEHSKDTVYFYTLQHKIPVEEMKPLFLDAMNLILKAQKEIPLEAKLRRRFTQHSEERATILMSTLKELQEALAKRE